MTAASDINDLFAEYAKHPSPELRGQLFTLCQDLATPVRRRFGATNRVNGDRFDEALENAFLQLTEPSKMAGVRAENFANFFLATARNAMIDTMRKVGRERKHVNSYSDLGMDTSPPEPQGYDSPSYDISPFRRSILARLERLPADTLDTICQYLEGVTLEEIGARQAIPLGTVKSRMHRVRTHLEPLARTAHQHQAEELKGLSDLIPELRAMIDSRRAETTALSR